MERDPQAGTHARAGVLDLLHLGAKLGAAKLRGSRADPAGAGCRWARDVSARQGDGDIDVAIPTLPLEVVAARTESARLLGGRPGFDGYESGKLKTEAMRFLAPGALTIANGDAWLRLRPFNEQVLGTGAPHQFAQTFLGHVRMAFVRPVHNRGEISAAMARAMTKIVLGELPPGAGDAAADVTALFDAVQSPIKRKLLGFLYGGRRRRLYATLGRKRDQAAAETSRGEAGEQTLMALAGRVATDFDRDTLLQQTPHWMFTFTGSGTDLLLRTLCMVTSRPDVHARVLEEIRTAGATDRAETIGRLVYLEACIRETGRLFTPVTKTFHKASAGKGGGTGDILHYFPLLQRDDRLGRTVHDFRPERWLAAELDEPAKASNLFLRGPRACPGIDLILFVCKAAAARQLAELGLSARQERLARDPLPVSFPKVEQRFTASEGRS